MSKFRVYNKRTGISIYEELIDDEYKKVGLEE